MNHSEIAHTWAHENYGRNEGRTGNSMYSCKERRAVFSYGHHFCIARHTDVEEFRVLHTYRTYSNSTSKHVGYVKQALSVQQRANSLECYNPNASPGTIYNYEMSEHLVELSTSWAKLSEEVTSLIHRIAKRAAKKLEPSVQLSERLDDRIGKREHALGEVRKRTTELERFRIAFRIRLKDIPNKTKLLRNRFLNDKWESVSEENAAAAKREAERLYAEEVKMVEIRKAANEEILQRWLVGEDVRVRYHGGAALLRVKGSDVQTTQGAHITVSDAWKLWKLVRRCRRREEGWRRNGETVDLSGYSLDSVTSRGDVVIGCHRISYEEMERVSDPVWRAFAPSLLKGEGVTA